jgi:hypothetical protein
MGSARRGEAFAWPPAATSQSAALSPTRSIATIGDLDDLFEREDVNAILSGIFDMNVALASIDSKLEALVDWLDIGGDDEEEEDDPLAPPDS